MAQPWMISSEIQPNYDGGLMRSKFLKGGFRTVKNTTQRNSIPYLYRYIDAIETTIVFVETDGVFYKLLNNPNSPTTLDSDWQAINLASVSSFSPVGTWDSNNLSPALQDTDAIGHDGEFYFVVNTPTQVTATYSGLFQGQPVTVVDGNYIVSVGGYFVVVANATTWDAIAKPSVIDDYVNGIVIAHNHTTADITDLSTFMLDYLKHTDVADHTIPFGTVLDAAIADVGFLRTWYYTKTEVNDLLALAGVGSFITLSDTPSSYAGQAGMTLRVNVAETGLEFVPFGGGTLASLSDTVISSPVATQFLQYRSDSKWHNSTLSGDVSMTETGVATVAWANGYTTYDARYLKLSGGTLTGFLTLNADPTSSMHAATKNYVDNLITGLTWKSAVQVATTANITLSGLQTIDGYTTISGDRVLVKNESVGSLNGIYIAGSGSWTRSIDADTANEILGSTVYVENGTVYGGTQWSNNNASIVLGSTTITYVLIAGAGVYTAGAGITLTGNVFSISAAAVTNSMLVNSSITIAGTSTSLGGSITLDTITGLSTTGLVKRTGANTLAIAVAGTDYLAPGGSGAALTDVWLLASGGTLTGANTITSSQPSGISFTGTWTNSGSSQYHIRSIPTITMTSTNSTFAHFFAPTYTFTSTNQNPTTLYLKSNYSIPSGAISVIGNVGLSWAVTNGTYNNVAASSQTGTGTGALMNFVITAGGSTVAPTIANGGTGYNIGDQLTFNASTVGGGTGTYIIEVTGISGYSINALSSVLTLSTNLGSSSTNNLIQFLNAAGSSIGAIKFIHAYDILGVGINDLIQFNDNTGLNTTMSQSGTFFSRNVYANATFRSVGAATFSSTISVTGTSTLSGAVTMSNTASVTGLITASSGVTATGGVNNTTQGYGYLQSGNMRIDAIGNNATGGGVRMNANIGAGTVETLSTLVGGSGYTNGSYTNVAATGGTGSSCLLNITVSGGAVTSAVLAGTGSQKGFSYLAGDVLSAAAANIGGTGSGFSITVATVGPTNMVFTGYHFISTPTNTSSNTSFIAFYANPTYNLSNQFTGKTVALQYSPTMSANTGSRYGILTSSGLDLNGFGTLTPSGTVDIRGASAVPTLKTVAFGTTTNYSYRAFQSDGTTEIYSLLDDGQTINTGVWTTTASAQRTNYVTNTVTTRATASDTFDDQYYKSVINPGATTQTLSALTIDTNFNLKGGISTFGTLQGNTTAGCTNGTTTGFSGFVYTNQDGTGATGTGATFNVTVASNAISSIVLNAAGSGYKIGDKFLFNGSSFGGSGSVYVEIITLASMSLNTNSTPLRIINRIYVPPQAGVSPLNKLVDLQTVDNTGTPVTRMYFGYYQNAGSTATSAIGDQFGEFINTNASSVTFTRALATSLAFNLNSTLSVKEITYQGTNTQTGASLQFLTSPVAQRMSVASQVFTALTTSNTITSGVPNTGTITNVGSGYTNGSYPSTTATGGTGTGLLLSITVTGNVVTGVVITANNAINYKVGDIVSATFGGGSGFQYTLNTVDFAGGVFASLRNIQTITDNGTGGNKYLTVYDKRTITQNNTAGTPYFSSLEVDITVSSGTPNLYPIIVRNTTGLNGVGLSTNNPTAIWDIRGNIAGTPTLNTSTTWTSTANNQKVNTLTSTLTFRGTASDTLVDNYWTSVFNLAAATQNPSSFVLDYNAIMTGGLVTGSLFTQLSAPSTLAGMTATTYTSISAASTSGSGTSAVFTIVVNSATTISSVTVTTAGSNYKVNDTVTFNGSQFGAGSGSIVYRITGVTGQTLGNTASVLRLINRLPSTFQGPNWKAIQFEDGDGDIIGSFQSKGGLGGRSFGLYMSSSNINVFSTDGATLVIGIPVTITTSALTMGGNLTAVGGAFSGAVSSTYGSNTTSGTFGTGMAAYSHVANKPSSIIANSSAFTSYLAQPTITTGAVNTLGAITAGSGYTNGTYNNVPMTGGSGTSLTCQITVAGGVVTVVNVSSRGQNYLAGDTLSAAAVNIGGTGSGFSIPVSTVDFSSVYVAGYIYGSSQTSTSSTYAFYGFYGTPTYNLSSQFTGLTAAFLWNPTMTANTGSRYGILINSALDLNGFGTLTPKVTVDIAGGLATRATSPGSIGSSQNDYAIGAGTFFRLTASTPVNITGFTGGFDGKIMTIRNIGTNAITITNEDAASTAANRITSSTGANIVLNAKGSIVLVYDATASRWLDFALR